MLPANHREDRRIQKTKDLLRNALASLISEKSYRAIVVKEILARANVGRSAFYTHFRDKDDLLVNSIHEMLRSAQANRESMTGSEKIIWFSLPIFEYHYNHSYRKLPMRRGKALDIETVHAHLKKILVELIDIDINREYQKQSSLSRKIPASLLAEYIASTFILVLNWWVSNKMAVTPVDANHRYRALLLPTLKDIF